MFSETISRFLTHLGEAAYFGLVAVLLLAVPIVLVWLVAAPLIRERDCGSRYGLVAGLAVASWASLCELCLPYIGLYPNLPGAALALVVGANAPWVGELCIHGTNAVLWPLLGWFGFRFRQNLRTSRA
jgi:hypothetical protein